jgi:hypothetical protein
MHSEIICSDLPESWREDLRTEQDGSSDEAAVVLAGLEAMGARIEIEPQRTDVRFSIPTCGVQGPFPNRPAQVAFYMAKVTLCSASSPASPLSCS